MKAIVHIGTEKTGTTSIQRFLFHNRKALKGAGYHFVQSAGKTNNRALPAYCVSDDAYDDFLNGKGISTPEGREKFRRNFIRKFESEIESLPDSIHTVVISSEHFHSRLRSEQEMENVYKLLSTYFDSIKIVCYLREQGTTCTSYYSTTLRAGETKSFSEFLRACTPRNYYYNYYEMLGQWEKHFGFEALDVSLFDQDKFLNGDLLDDFTAKIDPKLVGALDKRIKIENESLRPTGQALARAINCAFPVRTVRAELLPIRERLQEIVYRELKGKGRQPSLATRKEIFNFFLESNEKLKAKYFPDVENIFDRPGRPLTVDGTVDAKFIEVLIKLLDAVKNEGAGVVREEEYSVIYMHILSCIGEISVDEGRKRGKEVTLNEDDARLFKNAALRLEKKNREYAMRLMSLAGEILPSPPILEKLEEYAGLKTRVLKSQYLITYRYHSDDDHVALQPVLFGAEFQSWLKQLENPLRSAFNPLKEHKSISQTGTVESCSKASSVWAFTVFNAESMEQAMAIVAGCPFVLAGGLVEVSELVQLMPAVSQV